MNILELVHRATTESLRRMNRLSGIMPEFRLALLKSAQKDIFLSSKSAFLALLADFPDQRDSEFTTSAWLRFAEQARTMFVPRPPFSFLRSKLFLKTMFLDAGLPWLRNELDFLEGSFPKQRLKMLLQEDYVGKPYLASFTYLTSHNSIHQLYHLARLQTETNTRLNEVEHVVEWGGGYGNMAKIMRRINSHTTYTIIDIPIFSCIQWLYLSTVTNSNEVNIVTSPETGIEPGKINLLPLTFLTAKCDLPAVPDIFIATWSLSESSTFAQDYVVSSDFFGAKHLLLAFQTAGMEFPDASRLSDIAHMHGARVCAIDFLPGNYYAFR